LRLAEPKQPSKVISWSSNAGDASVAGQTHGMHQKAATALAQKGMHLNEATALAGKNLESCGKNELLFGMKCYSFVGKHDLLTVFHFETCTFFF
jgi:hypothetical protein